MMSYMSSCHLAPNASNNPNSTLLERSTHILDWQAGPIYALPISTRQCLFYHNGSSLLAKSGFPPQCGAYVSVSGVRGSRSTFFFQKTAADGPKTGPQLGYDGPRWHQDGVKMTSRWPRDRAKFPQGKMAPCGVQKWYSMIARRLFQ